MNKFGLYLKFSAIISFFILVIMVVVGYVFIRGQAEYIRNRLRQSGKTLLAQFAHSVRMGLKIDDDILLLNAARAAYRPEAGINEVYLINHQGEIIAHNNPELIGASPPSISEGLLVKRKLRIKGKGRYTAVLHFSQEVISKLLEKSRTKIIEATLIVLAGGLLGAGFLSGVLTKPIIKLTESVEKIAEGEYGYQIELNRQDEIGSLADSINNMSQRILEDRQQLIEKQKLENELKVGRSVQKTLLPEKLPEIENYSISAEYQASRQVSGDLYDFLQSRDKLYFFVADASGKGIPGALLMANTLASMRVLFGADYAPDTEKDLLETMVQLNSILKKNFQERTFISLFGGILHLDSDILNFIRCGHNPLLRFNHSNSTIDKMEPPGTALGVLPSSEFRRQNKTASIQLQPGDFLYQYSDGITEMPLETGERLGITGLCEIINSGNHTANSILETVWKKADQEMKDIFDDVVLVSIGYET